MKISNMTEAAARAHRRLADTTGGTFILVGWDGQAVSAGEHTRISLPHIKVELAKSDTVVDVERKLAMAVVELRKMLPQALARWKTPPPPKPAKTHGWARKGDLKRKGK